MPRLLKGLRQRGRSFFFRIRSGGVDRTIPLGQDFDRAVTRALEIRRAGRITRVHRLLLRDPARSRDLLTELKATPGVQRPALYHREDESEL